jgi:TatD DNase family protein
MIPFIDFHTHQDYQNNETIVIRNLTQNEWNFASNTEGVQNFEGFGKGIPKFSLGLHPWFLTKENFELDFHKLTQLVDYQGLMMIGECGLDRLKGEDLTFQSEAFAAQIQLAESCHKPVVIHCVKAYNELVLLKKKLKPHMPWVVHGFNQSEQILLELIKNDFYFSIGTAILRGGSNAAEFLPLIPIEKLFFETDDKRFPVKNVYEQAAIILNIEIEFIKDKVYKNFKNVLSL